MATHIVVDHMDSNRIVKFVFDKWSGDINLGVKYEDGARESYAKNVAGNVASRITAQEASDLISNARAPQPDGGFHELLDGIVRKHIQEYFMEELNAGLFLFLNQVGVNDLIKKLKDAGRTTFGKNEW